ncbi:MAG: alanine--glyoxylate aminotransferase family protein [Candidatus Omnitrophica bacterium]|nr:alanine--glyoxylate aminotransferase family protein [Candidatus Omnitrophota bacterium]
MKKNYLFTPGPTPIPEEVLLEMAKPIFHHRTPQFRELLAETNQLLKEVFQTNNHVYTFASSGTGAMEAAFVNIVSPGDEIIVVSGGKFGARFVEFAQVFGVISHTLDVPWGASVDIHEIDSLLRQHPNVKAVFTSLCETSTGVCFPVEDIARIVRGTNAVLVVDAISGLCADVLKTDEWGVDIVIGGSQKGLMTPPGLSFLTLSQKAWALAGTSRLPKYYFDIKKYRKAGDACDTPFTPATGLVIALRKALGLIVAEGVQVCNERHARLARATRAAMEALGLRLFAERPSNALTAVKIPDQLDAKTFITYLRDELGAVMAGGQGQLKNKIFRIAHLGYQNEFDLLGGIGAVEKALLHMGHTFDLGAGLKSFQMMINSDTLVNIQ